MYRSMLALALFFPFASIAMADEADDLLEKAFKAQAKDAETLKKLKTHVCMGKGKGRLPTGFEEVTMLRQCVWPGSFKITFVFGKEPMKLSSTVGVQDDRGWQTQANVAGDLPSERVSEVRMSIYGICVSMLFPLRESGVKVSVIPGVKVGGEPTVGLRVTRRAWPEVSLYFDEKTMLLRKQVFRSPEQGVTVTKEDYFEDYKNFDGINMPTKIRNFVGGVEMFSWEGLDYTFPASLEKEIFDKPQPKK